MTTRPPQDKHGPDGPLPAVPQDEELSDPGDLSEDLPPDEEGDLLDDRSQGENLSPGELGIDDGDAEDGWTHESEGDEDGKPEDVGDLGSEYGWTSDVEEPGTDDWDEDLGAGLDDGSSVLDDAGDEGAAEETDLGDLAFEPLEHEEDGEEGESNDGLAGDGGGPGEDRAELPPRHDESRILLRSVGPAEGTLAALVGRDGGGLVAGGDGLYSADESGMLSAVDDGPLESESVTSIAVDPTAPDRIVVGTMLSGAFTSADGGHVFAAANGWRAAARRGTASTWVCHAGSAILLRTADGELFGSPDQGATWKAIALPGRALAHGGTPTGRLAVLCAGASGPVLALSDDAGASLRVGPPRPELRALAACSDVQLAVGSGLIVIGAEDESRAWASHDEGASFEPWAAAPGVTAVAVHPTVADRCVLAICLPAENRAAVLRTADGGRTFTTLFELGTLRMLLHLDAHGDEEGENRVSGLSWGPRGGGSILVASSAGGFIVQVKDDEPAGLAPSPAPKP